MSTPGIFKDLSIQTETMGGSRIWRGSSCIQQNTRIAISKRILSNDHTEVFVRIQLDATTIIIGTSGRHIWRAEACVERICVGIGASEQTCFGEEEAGGVFFFCHGLELGGIAC
jgi:hypothetical protein